MILSALLNLAGLLSAQGSYAEARSLYERALAGSFSHLSRNMPSMTEAERFQYLAIKRGPEQLLLNLVAIRGEGPKED